tara:strand:+ start:827 stop:1039 length:213 start_codon:yes stop_codon:yes gene_type:complete
MDKKEMYIFDDNGKKFKIKNLTTFKAHIDAFHNIGESIHEENGFSFTINNDFRKKINKLFNKYEDSCKNK